jgi:hypothetical protein
VKAKLAALSMGLLFALMPALPVGALVALVFQSLQAGLLAGLFMALLGLDVCFRGSK